MFRHLVFAWVLAWPFAAGISMLTAQWAQAQLLSPGPLHSTHASIEGDNNCTQCHSEGKKVARDKCFECHEELGKRMRAGKGLHGRNYRQQRCEECHIEHLGRNSRLIRWPGGDRMQLNHADTGWPLKGNHLRVGCDECHTKRTPSSTRTYLGLKTECNACHRDQHNGRFGTTCNDCHNESAWKSVDLDKFNHDLARFPLKGKHNDVDCERCHGIPARYTGLDFANCSDCHEDPHKGRFRETCETCHSEDGWDRAKEDMRRRHPGLSLANGHRRVPCEECHDRGNTNLPSQGTRCQDCHKPIHIANFGRDCKECHAQIKWVGLPERVGRSNHGKTRYPLEGRHRQVGCEECHPTSRPEAKRFRNTAFDRCDRCHEDQHKGAFVARDGGECSQCHTVQGYLPTLFGLDAHKTTDFPLTGRHQAVACGQCHKSPRPRLAFQIDNQACADCHENPHGDQFATEMAQGGCAHCHSTNRWQNPNVDHSIWPLTGAHSRAMCSSCHTPSEEDRATGRGATYRGLPRQCDGCHMDEHAGQFRLSEPVRGCEVCHQTEGFRIQNFEHDRLTGYPLVGQHQDLTCNRCHREEQLRNGMTTVRYRLGYRECRDCHANPHRE